MDWVRKGWPALALVLLLIAGAAALLSQQGEEPRSLSEQACALENRLDILQRGVHESRSGEILLATRSGVFLDPRDVRGGPSGLDPSLASVPIVFFAPGRVDVAGFTGSSATHADVAPTLASLLKGSVSADGTPLPEVGRIDARSLRRPSPRLVLTVVWQGGGWNVLEQWPGDWPNLLRMIEGGVAYEGRAGTLGLGPAVAAATLATGRWPATHGITDEIIRRSDGTIDQVSLDGGHAPPGLLAVPLYERWQRQQEEALTGSVQAADAVLDITSGDWGADRIPDLLTVVDDAIALAGAAHGVDSEQTNEAVTGADRRLGRLLGVLDEVVGEGRYVVALTADGGHPLDPEDVPSVAIDPERVRGVLDDAFGPVVEAVTPTQVFLQRDLPEGVTSDVIAGHLAGLKVGDVTERRLPGDIGASHLFDLAAPREQIGRLQCRASAE
ncbi:MAG: alkaline phosphatase family protein [Actinomycetota bacterium]